MIMTRFHCLLLALVLSSFIALAQQGNAIYNAYIDTYSEIAVLQQKKHGIPASITLAQGILESGAGRGTLAVKGNNHFGIKCHDWTGAKIYHDDDKKDECFRKYRRALDSYEDHSAFLTGRSRYASLFDLETTDYKGWAHGLKSAGYATDPTYAHKLISIIEGYELHRFDSMTTRGLAKKNSGKKNTTRQSNIKQPRIVDTTSKKSRENLPAVGSVYAYSTHDVMKTNGLKYVIACLGDTYGSIADEFGIKEKNILAYNEMQNEAKPKTGERVYLQKKKKKASKGFDTHTIQQGESLYGIAQFYGIRLIDLFDMNTMPYSQKAEVGQVLKLRP